jgi:ABC-type phosphate/phosphonate transport system substrate-binding protein
MKGQSHVNLFLSTFFAPLAAVSMVTAGEHESIPTGPVRIGMVSTLFRDTPEPLVRAMMQPFGALMESQTGLTGHLIPGGDGIHLGQLLAEDKVELGVFHGLEFAWARLKHPELRPLMLAVNQNPHLHAVILVSEDSEFDSVADLKGKTLAFPAKSREHCHLFLEHRCKECKLEPKNFFGQITNPPTVEDAIDDVVDGIADATLVDSIAVDCYSRRKPGRYAKLSILLKSETFPAAVVAYHPGVLDEATLRKFREGMQNANKGIMGRQMMSLWKLTAFEPIPTDYEQNLTDIVKAYPPPKEK